MATLGERSIELLPELIRHRTVNPEGDERALCDHLAGALRERGADAADVVDVPRAGAGGAPLRPGSYVFARYGTPRLLVNAHVDTVAVNRGWTRDPFAVTREGERLYGLGTADTKGAIAAVLAALENERPRDVGILFSGDEECGTRVMHAFLQARADGEGAGASARAIDRAIVCEPSGRRAGVTHRGVIAQRATVRGAGGHSSGADRMPRPIVTMARLAVALDELGRSYLGEGPPDMRGVCMNVAKLDGGVAFNVVPDSASLDWCLRPPPGFDRERYDRQVADAIRQTADADASVGAITVASQIDHPPFSCRDQAAVEPLVAAHVTGFVTLDFWTEAALFDRAGIAAVVVGPGDIAQAHAPDEFVTAGDLAWAAEMFADVFARSR